MFLSLTNYKWIKKSLQISRVIGACSYTLVNPMLSLPLRAFYSELHALKTPNNMLDKHQ